MMNISARLLGVGDEDRVDLFLRPHTPFAFFMRSNMKHGGSCYEGKPYQSDYFGVFESEKIVGVLAHSWISTVQIFAADKKFIPDLVAAWRDYRAANPREINTFLGPADQVETLLSESGIPSTALRGGDTEEGLFTLSLERLKVPSILEKQEVVVRYAKQEDIDLLVPWRHAFSVEALGDPPSQKGYDEAKAEIIRRTDQAELFILEDCGQPVSFCGVGGFLPDWRSVGPVWTPPEKRNCGYGRAVVAGALLIMRQKGLTNAVLFAQRADATRAYRAIGFDRIGDWHLTFLAEPIFRL